MGGGIFLLLGATFGLVRFDAAAKGYYTKWGILTALLFGLPLLLPITWLAALYAIAQNMA